jgi:PAS domain-containing protein
MDQEQVEPRIKSLLKQFRRGLTITDLSSRLGMNRNAAVKYLEVLEIKGEIESYKIGNAKIFVLAHRLPISAIFNLATNPVCVIDDRNILIFANRNFHAFFGSSDQGALHHPLEEIEFNGTVTPNPKDLLRDLSSEEEIREVSFQAKSIEYHFRIRRIPVIFEDGRKGTSFLFEDVTKEKKYLKNLEFLARTSAELADMGESEDIYQYIADRVAELEPKAHINVSSVDPERLISRVRAISSRDQRYLQDFEEALVPLGDMSAVLFDMNKAPVGIEVLMKGCIVEGPRSLYEHVWRMLPESVCNEIQEKLHIERYFVMGCSCRGGLYGHTGLRFREGDEMENRETVEAFIKQAGVALQRRYLREKLRRMEEQVNRPGEK